jgi:S-adenosyl-L-methionine hydrolase (adenosine-forming)
MPASKTLITLTTDFGTADHYTAAMKGVIKSICPAAEILDLTHALPAYDIQAAAYVFSQAWPWFPPRTIHVTVIDPGVGSARRPLLVEAAGQYFIGPDNGILTSALEKPKARARHITNKKFALADCSHTFHGRDLFAPAAAHLGAKAKPAQFGKLVADALRLHKQVPQRTSKRQWTGVILHVDAFGNCITNFTLEEFPWIASNPFSLAIGFEQVTTLATHFADCPYGELTAIRGSSGFIEIVLREANAAKKLGVPVELTGWAKTDA